MNQNIGIKTKSIKIFLFYFIYIGNLLGYSFTFKYFGSDGAVWAIWAFSNYITLFLSFIATERFIRAINIKRNVCLILTSALIHIVVFCLGFFVSKINLIWIIVLVLSVVLLVSIALFVLLLFLVKKKGIKNNQNEKKIDNLSVEQDILSYYVDKKEIKKEDLKKTHNSIAAANGLIVYILFLVFTIFANVVCHNVLLWHIIFEIVIGIACLGFNFFKLIKIQANLKKIVLESTCLIFTLIVYLVVEWILIPVTFNVILILIALIAILPIHITQAKIYETQMNNYGEKNESEK